MVGIISMSSLKFNVITLGDVGCSLVLVNMKETKG